MAKKNIVEDRLTIQDILRFRPRKAPLDCMESLLFKSNGDLCATNLEYSMLVKAGHKSNMDVLLGKRVIEQLSKAGDWPSRLNVSFVDKERESGDKVVVERFYSVVIATEKGHNITYNYPDVHDPADFPSFDVVQKWDVLGTVYSGGARGIKRCFPFVDTDDDGAPSNLVSYLNAEGGKVWGFNTGTGIVAPLVDPFGKPQGLKFKLGRGFAPYIKECVFMVLRGNDRPDHIKVEYADGSYMMSSIVSQSKQYPCTQVEGMLANEFDGVKLVWKALVSEWREMLAAIKPFTKQTKGYTRVVVRIYANGRVELLHAALYDKNPVYVPVPAPEIILQCDAIGCRDLTVMLNPDFINMHVAASDPTETLSLVHYGSKWMAGRDGGGAVNMHQLRVHVTNDPTQRLIYPYMDSGQIVTH